MNIKREINEYLFYEFSFDLENDVSSVTEEWPFTLHYVGGLDLPSRREFFRFSDGEDDYYATGGDHFGFLPALGMELDDLKAIILGIRWIDEHDPITLNMSLLGDDSIPRVPERRAAIENLAREVLGSRLVMEELGKAKELNILEGLFLRRTREYISLIGYEDEERPDILIKANTLPVEVGFRRAAPYRRVGWAIGQLLKRGLIA